MGELATQYLMSLHDTEFKYFAVMVQTNIHQFLHLVNWTNIMVFYTRSVDSVETTSTLIHNIPIPQLYYDAVPWVENKLVTPQREVFFAGHCHGSQARNLLGPGKLVPLGHTDHYAWNVHNCDNFLPYAEYVQHVNDSTWLITPSGTYPPVFMMYQAMQGGSLPIFPY